MRKNNQSKIRQAWMRKFRRANEGRGYVLHRTSPITARNLEGPPVTYPGKLYILKDDGRKVLERKDQKTGRVTYEIVTNQDGSPVV